MNPWEEKDRDDSGPDAEQFRNRKRVDRSDCGIRSRGTVGDQPRDLIGKQGYKHCHTEGRRKIPE